MRQQDTVEGVQINGQTSSAYEAILSPQTLSFLSKLHHHFNAKRLHLLKDRAERQRGIDKGAIPNFLEETKEIREGNWKVAPPPTDLKTRTVEITGPTTKKMMINALNSGANVFMADFEDSLSPLGKMSLKGKSI